MHMCVVRTHVGSMHTEYNIIKLLSKSMKKVTPEAQYSTSYSWLGSLKTHNKPII